ncbi:MAG: fructosamine kinase family protein [Gammaproteobacteria bacterium]|nr:fructosamine kinase family protein [Gammaproteobacteria bacterium]NIR84230.1 fructosamine kinase family protein [Gammaproteobacteria bacterium]NIR89700.1 fructosamine kinase family protein [Gammaproteobacteria bacterium]NIU05388.1 fructosamine kinase family protein [Gammaproteobacteria bacterium]NIV52334.1 phosphotransferase [Gammaproteobacteria bacterium]
MGDDFAVEVRQRAGGGCINAAYVIEGCGRRFFVKVNEAHGEPMFEAEAAGLRELAAAGPLRVPTPVCWGAVAGTAFLTLEYIPLGPTTAAASARLGRGLAQLHRARATQHGWHMDNTIGATPQPNGPLQDWVSFYRERRLLFQLSLAAQAGHPALERRGRRLAESLEAFFPGYAPVPSLLHGDLWSGNCAADDDGDPVLFDPAVYYGDRESDLAMTELFGGFPAAFYDAYREAWPLDEGYAVRRTLYQLYHVLNHLNLFGGGYAAQAERMIDRLLGQVR